jgi:lipid-binding SYLF domain-containing protein
VGVGPIGGNEEAAGVAALNQVAAIYSYSKTKGLFAGRSKHQ